MTAEIIDLAAVRERRAAPPQTEEPGIWNRTGRGRAAGFLAAAIRFLEGDDVRSALNVAGFAISTLERIGETTIAEDFKISEQRRVSAAKATETWRRKREERRLRGPQPKSPERVASTKRGWETRRRNKATREQQPE